jgi:CheY-like chemotaxis protein
MILIIDDDVAVRSSLDFLLKRAGYETQAVADPKETLDAEAIHAGSFRPQAERIGLSLSFPPNHTDKVWD